MLMIVVGSVVGVLMYDVHFKTILTMSVAPMASLFFVTLFQFSLLSPFIEYDYLPSTPCCSSSGGYLSHNSCLPDLYQRIFTRACGCERIVCL